MEDFKWLKVLLFETTFFYGNKMIILLWWNETFRISAYISMLKCTTSLEVSNLTCFRKQATLRAILLPKNPWQILSRLENEKRKKKNKTAMSCWVHKNVQLCMNDRGLVPRPFLPMPCFVASLMTVLNRHSLGSGTPMKKALKVTLRSLGIVANP